MGTEKLIHLEKLDTVLKSLEKHHSERHHDFIAVLEDLEKDKTNIDFGELTYILNKLHKDGLIDIKKVPIKGNAEPTDYYYINFEGRLLNELDGYSNKFLQEKRQQEYTDQLAKSTLATNKSVALTNKIQIVALILTIAIAAIGAIFQGLDYFNNKENNTMQQQIKDISIERQQLEQELKSTQKLLEMEKQKPDSSAN